MVNGEGNISSPTILASVSIPSEDVFSRQDDLLVGDPDIYRKPDNTWKRVGRRHGVNLYAFFFSNKFGFSEIQKNNGFSDIDDTHRFIILIQNQNLGIHPAKSILRT